MSTRALRPEFFPLHQIEMLAGKDDLFFLIEDFYLFNHVAVIRLFGVIPFFSDSGFDGDGVADVDGANEADAIVAVGEGNGVDDVGGHTNGDTENKRTMGDAALEFLGFDPFLVHMVGKKVACLPCVQHDIGFSNSATECFAAFSNFVLFKGNRSGGMQT